MTFNDLHNDVVYKDVASDLEQFVSISHERDGVSSHIVVNYHVVCQIFGG